MKNYFLSPKEIEKLFQKAFSILYSKGYEKAKKQFDQVFARDPYRIEYHYQLAVYFAQQKNEELFLHHLSICYQIDFYYIDIAIQNPSIVNYINVEKVKTIKEKQKNISLHFESIEPISDPIVLQFKNQNRKKRTTICSELSIEVKQFFDIYDLDKISLREKLFDRDQYYQDTTKKYKLRNSIKLDRYEDHYSGTYAELYVSIKELAPYLENVRFFMYLNYEKWVDEIYIRNGIFYSYRHELSSNYDLLELYEKLVKRNPKDRFLKMLVSDLYYDTALHKIQYKEIYDGEVEYYLKQAKRYYPKNAKLNHAWGEFYWQNSEWDLAKKYFLQFIKKIRDYDTIIKLGKMALWGEEYKKAQSYFSEAIQQRPNYIDAHFYRGLCYEHQHQLKKARKDYQFEINGMQNYNAHYLVGKGNRLIDYHFNESARPFFNSAIQKAKSYKKELTQQEKKSPSTDTSFYYRRLKDMDSIISDAYVGLSLIATTFDENMKFSQKAIEKNPLSPTALYNIGVLLQKRDELEQANEYYNRALQYDDKYIKALNNKSIIAHAQGKYYQLFFIGNRMIEIDPHYANGWLILGNAYFYSKQYQEALSPYYQFIALEPKSEKGYHALCTTYAWLGEYEKSIQAGKKALKINPNLAEIISDIAGNYNNLNKYKQALIYAEKAIKVNPSYYHPYYIKACVYAKMNKTLQAIEMIKRMLHLDGSKLELVRRESDFENLKNDQEFKKVFQ